MSYKLIGKTGEINDVRSYVDSPETLDRLHKRTLFIVVLSQMFGGAGLAAGVTVGALLAQEMLRTESLAGIPSALFTLGSALAALLVGRLSQRFGRRLGLAAGFITGGLGAIGIVIAAVINHIPLLFLSLFIYGAGTATNLQARYAGTDLAKPTERARAISIAMISTTLGAVAGPNLVEPLGSFALSIGVPALAGPFLLAAIAYIFAGLVLWAFLRPDPFMVAKAIAELHKNECNNPSDQKPFESNHRGILIGATIMVLTQLVMMAIMTMTPIHMKHHGHDLGGVGLVIGIHIGSMYIPSLITGMLVDKLGRTVMSMASGAVLLLAGVVAAVVPGHSLWGLIIALALLGIGWNFGLISGTALIVDATPPETRAKTQGSLDVFIALAGASGGALSGIIVAFSSYEILSVVGGILSLLLIPVVIWSRSSQRIRDD